MHTQGVHRLRHESHRQRCVGNFTADSGRHCCVSVLVEAGAKALLSQRMHAGFSLALLCMNLLLLNGEVLAAG